MKHAVAILLLSTLLIFLFGYTAVSKLQEHEQFRATLARMPVIGTGAGVLAFATPLAELVIVLLLLFSTTRRKGLWTAMGLLSLFTVFLLYLLLFVPHLPCSCGGVISSLSWTGHLGMNVGLVGLVGVGLRRGQRSRGTKGQRGREESTMSHWQ